ncbi:DUF1543 domain-containing protein [Moraxella nasovis]|uniref:DUF1543 domain-containing protein n=1 Tax=Moraxella nasovis TaxID=2904121 RepID=UPI001F601808|nr:DUF1543 domain-containing protein [Moraxella nasovis]UNU73114.1 DUF1543 domain-containing protein [Moraxella nasovis]
MMKLYMLKIGATPRGRLIEQHDVLFGLADDISELVTVVDKSWVEAAGIWHLDAYRTVTYVDGFDVSVVPKSDALASDYQLFFVNLGGYKPNHFEEFHHKMLIIAKSMNEATAIAKKSDFYREFNIEGTSATSHIDDKHSVMIDEIYAVSDVLAGHHGNLSLQITPSVCHQPDEMMIGYFPRKSLIV